MEKQRLEVNITYIILYMSIYIFWYFRQHSFLLEKHIARLIDSLEIKK